ncbi:hypothetical protein [Paenibacillus lacisoli]|nr:hypothetical protein [Paenibacillus sp. JX-17]
MPGQTITGHCLLGIARRAGGQPKLVLPPGRLLLRVKAGAEKLKF